MKKRKNVIQSLSGKNKEFLIGNIVYYIHKTNIKQRAGWPLEIELFELYFLVNYVKSTLEVSPLPSGTV